MGLHIRRASSRKPQLVVTLFAAFAIVAQPLAATLQGIAVSAMTTDPDTSKITFKNSPKYVRENAAGDIGAQLITYSATTNVNFYINGDRDTPVPGVRHGVSKVGYDEWRLKTPLAAG